MQKDQYKFLLSLSLTLVETLLILHFSLSPTFEPADVGPGRKGDMEHFTAYLLYGILLERTMNFRMGKRRFIIALACASILGGITEILQGYIPYRFSDPLDWVIDTGGAATGILLLFAVSRPQNTQKRPYHYKFQELPHNLYLLSLHDNFLNIDTQT